MSLQISHNCFDGSYGRFGRFREALAIAAGLPPLNLMEGFFGATEREKIHADLRFGLPIRWGALNHLQLFKLLNHSDCEGSISWKDCMAISSEIAYLTPKLPEQFREDAKQMVEGMRAAYAAKSDLRFS